jgi:hypothetical protein
MFMNPVRGVMLNPFIPSAMEVYAHWREPREVLCPETGEQATIQVDAGRAAAMASVGLPGLKIIRCTQWPRKCGRGCMAWLS